MAFFKIKIMACENDYIDCTNKEKHVVELFKELLALVDGKPAIRVCGATGGSAGGATELTLQALFDEVNLRKRNVCDLVEVDIDGIPTPGTSIFRNFYIVRKFTQNVAGTEVLVNYFNVDGSPYVVLGTIQPCPEVLCCEDWTELVVDARLSFKQFDNYFYLNDLGESFQQGTSDIIIEIEDFKIDGVAQQGVGNLMTLTPGNIQFVETQVDSDIFNNVSIGTTENNYKNISDFFNSAVDNPLNKFYPYGDSTFGGAGENNLVVEIDITQDFLLVFRKTDALIDYRCTLSYNKISGIANFSVIDIVGGGVNISVDSPNGSYANIINI